MIQPNLKIKKDIGSLSDKELVECIVQTNDSGLFAELYDRYANVVYNKCYGFAKSKEEAQDLTHDLFIYLFVRLRTYKGRSKFSTWLYSFIYNFCINYVTRNKQLKNNKLFEENVTETENKEIDTSEAELFELKCEKLDLSLNKLEPRDKAILLMKYHDDFSIIDIQKALDISESAVKMRLRRARGQVITIYERLS